MMYICQINLYNYENSAMKQGLKKTYTSPRLKSWGNVAELTLNNGNGNGGFSAFGGKPKGNNGVGNGEDGQPPGNPPINDGPGTGPGNPGNKGGPKNR